jgi:poly(beta-D-mannuronate) lyase
MMSYDMKMIRILCFFACFIFSISHGFATDYYITTPAEISAKMQIAQSGDTLTMANGVWTDARIIFRGNGAESDSILLRAETPGYVILNGISILRIAGKYLKVDGLRFVGGYSNSGAVVEFRYSGVVSQHCRMTNCSIVDYNPSNKDRDYKWVSLYGYNNRVDHCYFEGKTNSGTTLVVWLDGQPNYHRIDQNYFGHRPPLGFNGGETIRVGTSDWSMYDSFSLIESNYFEYCNGEIEIISNKSGENIYRHNTFFECEGALTLRHGNKATIEGNFFIGNQNYLAGGVRVIGEDHKIINNYFHGLYGNSLKSALPIMNGVPNSPLNRYFQVKRALIAFNTFVDCRYTMILGAGSDNERTLPPLDCVIANNVVQTNHKIISKEDEPKNLAWEGNIMQGSSLGITQPSGIILKNPNLTLHSDGLYRPDSLSPILSAAQGNYDFVSQDMDGQARGQSKDVGADQISNEPIHYRPLTAKDVGPDWKLSTVPFVLAIRKSGSGQVNLDPPGQIYNPGSLIQAVAVPDSGWRFKAWEGDVESTNDSIQIIMDDNKSLKAVFESDAPA